jgi:hypothetical protein
LLSVDMSEESIARELGSEFISIGLAVQSGGGIGADCGLTRG